MMEQASPLSYTLSEIAALTAARLDGDPNFRVYNVAELEKATERDASFLANAKYTPYLAISKAGVVFVHEQAPRPSGRHYLIHDDPSVAFQTLVSLFRKEAALRTGFTGVHPSAVIHPEAVIGKEVSIGPQSVIDSGAVIGDRTWIHAGCYIGPHVHIGADCELFARVVIRERCLLGQRVTIQPGAVIGSCGFGYHTDKRGCHNKLEQTGNVVIEDDVEIGANTTIDRARFDETRIGRGTKIDNLVQIAHNVCLGPDNLIVSQVGVAGSSKTGRHVVLAGQSALVGHISVADQTVLAARGGLSKSVTKPGQKLAGAPAVPLQEFHRQTIRLRQLDAMAKRLEDLERRVGKWESETSH